MMAFQDMWPPPNHTQWVAQPVWTTMPAPIGCICPPGANKECERADCPRKGPPSDFDPSPHAARFARAVNVGGKT